MEREVEVCTQPFEGYSAPFAKINQIARSLGFFFTELQNHIMLAHSVGRKCQHTVSHTVEHMATPGGGGSRDGRFQPHGLLEKYF